MRCVPCGRDNPPGARFCNGCGAPLLAPCPACRHDNPPGSRFCNACGRALEPGTPPGAARPSAPAAAHPPAHIAERILTSRGSLEGERKQVTVLFADLKGSMELLADRDPEEARTLLDPLLEHMIEAVHRYEGTVNQVMGDGIMGLFGAPLAYEDHALRACYAALRMQAAAARYGAEVQRAHGVPVQIRVGLNSGEVVVRAIGSDLHMDYTAVGQTTHLAARMEQMALAGSILITAETLRLAEGYVRVTALGAVPIRGLAEPVEVFELVGAATTRTRLEASAPRGLTRFVGREPELGHLQRALAQARTGQGQVVALVGEAGVGKSRLVWEFARSHRTAGWLLLEASSVSYGTATPLLPVLDVLRRYFDIEEEDDARKIRERVTGRILTLDEGLKPTLPVFLNVLGAAGEDPGWSTLPHDQRQAETADAVRRLFLRESRVQPILLVFEDLHWIDADTQAVLDRLVESLQASPVLLLVNYRPEYRHGWTSKTCYHQLRLDSLTSDTAEAFLDAVLGRHEGLPPLKALLIARTEGNPFFLEESVRTLAETGALLGERGAYRLARPIQAIHVPATVQAILAARIDRLSPGDKHLLQCASVIGKDVPLALLGAIADTSEDALRGALARLHSAEFLYEARLFPEVEYAFRHALTLEVAYDGLLLERRRGLHARIVDALERLYPARRAEQADRLAHHAFRGEVWGKALTYLRETYLRETGGDSSHFSFDAAIGGPESPGYLWWTGSYDRALSAAQRDLAVASSFGNFGMSIVASFRLGQVHHARADYERAIVVLQRVVSALAGDLGREAFGMAGLPAVFARAWLALCHAERGEFVEAIALADEGLHLAEAGNDRYSLVVASFGLGAVALLQGSLDRALPVLERGLVVGRMTGIPFLLPLVAAPLGAAYAGVDRARDGLSLLEPAVEQAAALKWMANQSRRLGWLAEGRLRAGRADQATHAAGLALDLARDLGERGNEAYARCLLGEVVAHAESPSPDEAGRAEGSLREAFALAEALGMRPLLARCRLALGALERRAGRLPEARAELDAAVLLLRGMDAPSPLARAEAELAALA